MNSRRIVDPMMIPYNAIIRMNSTLYGVTTDSPSVDFFVSEIEDTK